jgi:hypothetical protein
MADKPIPSSLHEPSAPFGVHKSFLPLTTSFSTSSRLFFPTMSSRSSPANSVTSKKPFDISNLMSPPEPSRVESFSHESPQKPTPLRVLDGKQKAHGPNPPLSPPISPATKNDSRMAEERPPAGLPMKDPILYPSQDATRSPAQQPLFVPDDTVDTQRIVDNHVVSRPATLFREATPPEREDYELMLYFKTQVMKKYQDNPRRWLQREHALLLEDRRARARHNKVKLAPLQAKPQPIKIMSQRVVKPVKTIKPHSAPRPIRSQPTPAPRQPAVRRISTTPDPSSRRIVAPNREDKDFESLPDYCPPLSSLPNKQNSLKVDWKGAPIDLSSDPHRHLLHMDEIALAANLRLDCATYLTSKRRMFIRRLECLRMNKEFRKTDAQQACKIDVNKASKLWTAFEKVGWLEKDWISRFL